MWHETFGLTFIIMVTIKTSKYTSSKTLHTRDHRLEIYRMGNAMYFKHLFTYALLMVIFFPDGNESYASKILPAF